MGKISQVWWNTKKYIDVSSPANKSRINTNEILYTQYIKAADNQRWRENLESSQDKITDFM